MARSSSTNRPKRRRRVDTRNEKRTFLIFCEGELTDVDYLEALKDLPETQENAEIRIDYETAGSVPKTLVLAAADAQGVEDEIDEFWCVFDVEWPGNHPQLDDTLELANARGIRVAVSNPCFEYGRILHFEQPMKWLKTKQAVELRSQLDGSSGKEVDGAKYMPLRARALRRADFMGRMHARSHIVFPYDNPSSGMYTLLEAIER